MHLIIFITTFVVLFFALCCFIPYIGIVAIMLTLALGICLGALGVATKMRFTWISCTLAVIASLAALPLQIGYALHGAVRLGEVLIEHGHLSWAESIAPKISYLATCVSPEMRPQTERYELLVQRVADARQRALDEGSTAEQADRQAFLTFHQLVNQSHIEPVDAAK